MVFKWVFYVVFKWVFYVVFVVPSVSFQRRSQGNTLWESAQKRRSPRSRLSVPSGLGVSVATAPTTENGGKQRPTSVRRRAEEQPEGIKTWPVGTVPRQWTSLSKNSRKCSFLARCSHLFSPLPAKSERRG